MSRLHSLVFAVVCMVIAQANSMPAGACGDKLTVMGGGMPFDRIHSNHRHGNLILYLSPESLLSATNTDARLDQTLTRDGHQVRVVRTGAELKQALEQERADFVLSDWNEVSQLQPDVIAGVPVVPVIFGSSAEERDYAHSRSGCVVESAKGHNRQLVREIETLLENQESLAASCAGTAIVNG